MHPLKNLVRQIEDQHLWEKQVSYARNEYLQQAGRINTHLFYISKGSVRIFLQDEHAEHTIRFGYSNEIVTALDSFLSGQATVFYIQALRQTEVKMISKRRFEKLIHSTPANVLLWLSTLEDFILQQMEREQDLLTASPLARYQKILQRSPQLFQEVPHKYIAAYLRMTPETLSRLKKAI